MNIELSLAIIAITLVCLASVLIVSAWQCRKALLSLQSDLHALSVETTALVVQLNELATDLSQKSHSLNFLLKPFHFLSKIGWLQTDQASEKSQQESSSTHETVSQLVEWIANSLVLVKKTKELVKHYVKS